MICFGGTWFSPKQIKTNGRYPPLRIPQTKTATPEGIAAGNSEKNRKP